MRIIRIILALMILVVFICLAAVGAIIYFVDLNKIKPLITQEIATRIPAKVELKGDLQWSFYPQLGLNVAEVKITPPNQQPIVLQRINISRPVADIYHSQDLLKGKVTIGHVQIGKLKLQNISSDVNWQNKRLELPNFHAGFYQGVIDGNLIGYDFNSSAKWRLNVVFKQVSMEALLADTFDNFKMKWSGLGSGSVNIQTQGAEKNTLLAHVSGKTNFLVNDGVLDGIDINYYIKSADALMNKQPLDGIPNTSRTPFTKLAGNMTIAEGIGLVNSTEIASSSFRSTIDGEVALATQAIRLQLMISPTDEVRTDWKIPLDITGSLKDPAIRLNLQEIQKHLWNQKGSELKGKINEEIAKHLPQANKLLEKYLGH